LPDAQRAVAIELVDGVASAYDGFRKSYAEATEPQAVAAALS